MLKRIEEKKCEFIRTGIYKRKFKNVTCEVIKIQHLIDTMDNKHKEY